MFRTADSPDPLRSSCCLTSCRFSIALFGAAVCLLAFAVTSFGSAQVASNNGAAAVTLRGTLSITTEKAPLLKTSQKTYILQGQSPYLQRVLEDKRLIKQELEVQGTAGANGVFVVDRIYAVRNGRLYKIQYYCEVCNITYIKPGHCYCCGRETELQEVPVTPSAP